MLRDGSVTASLYQPLFVVSLSLSVSLSLYQPLSTTSFKLPLFVSLSVSLSLCLAVDACDKISCVVREVRFLVLEPLDEIDGVRIALSAAVSSLAPAQVLCVYCVCVCVFVIHTHID